MTVEASKQRRVTKDDLEQYDRSDGALLAHWRGFSKFRQPDGSVVAISDGGDGGALVLGPCEDGAAADLLIMDFYARDDNEL